MWAERLSAIRRVRRAVVFLGTFGVGVIVLEDDMLRRALVGIWVGAADGAAVSMVALIRIGRFDSGMISAAERLERAALRLKPTRIMFGWCAGSGFEVG